MSKRETILEAIKTILSPVFDGHVSRSRQAQLPSVPWIIVRPDIENASEYVLGMTDRRMRVDIEIHAKGEIPDQAADPSVTAVWAALMADPKLGFANDVRLEMDHALNWETEGFDEARVTLSVTVTYSTVPGEM